MSDVLEVIMKLLLFFAAILGVLQHHSSPQAAVDELLAADRRFAAGAATLNVTDALAAAFADDVVLPLPTFTFARGKAKAVEALNANTDNPKSRLEWAPVRGGVSADGQHGFTVGYMTLIRPDTTRQPLKYVAYWVRKPEGWRIAVLKRARAGEGTPPKEMLPPALPARLVPVSTDAAQITRHKQSLDQAERAFSDEAQTIGLGPAFAKHGSADAMNVGSPTLAAFVVGAEAIGKAIGQGAPPGAKTPIAWAPDEVIVASSGDLGITFGMIRRHEPPPPDQPAAVPYITIWRRASTSDPWRYVAE